jgi:hypothetical protein
LRPSHRALHTLHHEVLLNGKLRGAEKRGEKRRMKPTRLEDGNRVGDAVDATRRTYTRVLLFTELPLKLPTERTSVEPSVLASRYVLARLHAFDFFHSARPRRLC